jgi:hypothetical protein
VSLTGISEELSAVALEGAMSFVRESSASSAQPRTRLLRAPWSFTRRTDRSCRDDQFHKTRDLGQKPTAVL